MPARSTTPDAPSAGRRPDVPAPPSSTVRTPPPQP
jgi:hypothetical protein